MSEDEAQIRELLARWQTATIAGDSATLLSLMTDDVVFLLPGRAPMQRAEFVALIEAPGPRPGLAIQQQIREIGVDGELAWLWSELAVSVRPPGAQRTIERAGHTLTIFRKQDGVWKLARDANLLTVRAD
ncbi:MAG: nuclear transport factor 2 family protein [Lysobacterales bacterium]